ncbi:DUF669 domain-containing protein [Magnetococcus sp. PR-3]|uniref:DUF669 domain-containing protein n=1 Tax=Magnetococcus sp. PR-3 TaxID=3120355 RepID=UPI002FCDEAE7
MVGLPQYFDASTVEPNQPYEPIPAGDYVAQITSSEMVDNSAGTGQYLQLEFTVLQGECAGRKVVDRLNLVNPNPKAVEIAYGDLSAICHAVNVPGVNDSMELHGKPLTVSVKVKSYKDGDETKYSNEVKGYSPAAGVGAVPPQAQPQIQQPPAQPAPTTQTQTPPPAHPGAGAGQQAAAPNFQQQSASPQQQAGGMPPAPPPQQAGAPAGVPPWQQQQG